MRLWCGALQPAFSALRASYPPQSEVYFVVPRKEALRQSSRRDGPSNVSQMLTPSMLTLTAAAAFVTWQTMTTPMTIYAEPHFSRYSFCLGGLRMCKARTIELRQRT